MSNNTVKARIQLKNDTEANWARAQNFVPLPGEIIIYSADDFTPFSRIKIGDGQTSVVNLPFLHATALNIQYNTTEYWNANGRWIPAAGEVVIYSDGNTSITDGIMYVSPAFKIGDGETYLIDLPYAYSNNFQGHIDNTNIHVSAEDRAFWDNKLNLDDVVINETLLLNRR